MRNPRPEKEKIVKDIRNFFRQEKEFFLITLRLKV